MKKKYILPILLIAFLFTGCTKDFLNRTPLDSFDDSNFWESEITIRMHSVFYYGMYFTGYGASWDTHGLAFESFFASDITCTGNGDTYMTQGVTADWGQGGSFNSQPWATISWGNAYIWIRRANTFIDRVETKAKEHLTEAQYNHWLGVARFLRAERYADLVWAYGDVPYFDKAISTTTPQDIEALCKDRTNRYEVMANVIADFDFAVKNCYPKDMKVNNLLNRYSIATVAARRMLRIGCYNKYISAEYQGGDKAKATEYLKKAMEYANVVMTDGVKDNGYSISTDLRSVFTSSDLSSGQPEVILARYYKLGQWRHCNTTYSNYEQPSTQSNRGAPNAHYVRNVVLFQDGELEPDKTTVLGTPSIDNYGELYTLLDNKLYENKDPRLEAQMKTSRPMVSSGALTAAYNRSYNTNLFYPRLAVPRKYENYLGADLYSPVKIDDMLSASNVTNAPCLRYAEVLLTWITAKAELADGLGGEPVSQGDLDKTINVLRARPIASSGENPSMAKKNLVPLKLGVYPADPERDLEKVNPLLWEIRRERAVELFMDNNYAQDLRMFGRLLYVVQRYDKNPGKFNQEPNMPLNNYKGEYKGGDKTVGWGKVVNGVQYFMNNREGNLMQCGAYFELDKIFDRWMASRTIWKASNSKTDPDFAKKRDQAAQDSISFTTLANVSPKLWVVTKDGEQLLFPNIRWTWTKDIQGKLCTVKQYAATGVYDQPLDDATARAALQKMRGWFILSGHDLANFGTVQERVWLAPMPIAQIKYYRDRGYTLTQNPGWPIDN